MSRPEANKTNANIYQEMRFVGDMEFWKQRFPTANVHTTKRDTQLSFNLDNRADLERFRDAVLNEGPRLSFLASGQSAEHA